MNVVDLVVLAIVAVNAILGAVRGFAWQAFRIGSIVLAIYLANFMAADVAAFLKGWLEDWQPSQLVALAWVVIGVTTYFGMSIIGHFARKGIERLRLGSADRALGFLLGGLKGAAICAIAMQVVVSIGSFLPSAIQDELRGNAAAHREASRAFQFHMDHVRPLAESWATKAQEEWARHVEKK